MNIINSFRTTLTLGKKMSCRKCRTVFTLFTWKIKCNECEGIFCSKCLVKQDGLVVCEVCTVLIKRPVNRVLLMELKSKDLQDYLNRNNISTRGIVEKQELVEMMCRSSVPVKKKSQRKSPFGGSVPNLAVRSQTYLSNLRTNAEAAFLNHSRSFRAPGQHHQSASNSPMHGPAPPPVSESPRYSPATTPTTSTPAATQETSYASNASSAAQPPPSASSAQPTTKKLIELNDYECAEDLDELTGKELKELLALNRVDYRGCIEKQELIERAHRLWKDSHNHRRNDVGDLEIEEDCCKVCMDAPMDCVLLECGHIATCISCGKQLAECPICRQYVSRVVRTFKA